MELVITTREHKKSQKCIYKGAERVHYFMHKTGNVVDLADLFRIY